MKAKDLIKVLQCVNPEDDVTLTLGRTQDYRTMCAKAELAHGDCLNFLSIDRVEIYEGLWADIILSQDNIVELDEAAKEFDKRYK